MKYIKPHLSPELRAQITPHKRRDVKLIVAGVIFSLFSLLLVVNLWPVGSTTTTTNNKPVSQSSQSETVQASTQTTPVTPTPQVLGAATSQAQASTDQQFTQYTVKSGDTLFNISQQYNIRWDLIAQVNNLPEPYIVHSGDILKIPQATTSQVPDKIYTVKSGDTLASIAKAFNITTSDIIAVNPNLQNSDLITVGQIIKLP